MNTHENSWNGSLKPFRRWREGLGISATTAWRYRKNGLIKTVSVAGRVFVTDAEIEKFELRALAGEFERPANLPKANRN